MHGLTGEPVLKLILRFAFGFDASCQQVEFYIHQRYKNTKKRALILILNAAKKQKVGYKCINF
jgi:hypothetical protein